jgi:hypothetical protein
MNKSAPITKLIAMLMPEAVQNEELALVHCGREAERLGNVPPGVAMREVTEHARRVLARLRDLADAHATRPPSPGSAIGRTFTSVRDLATDIVMNQERSYRATLLCVHQCRSSILLLEDAAVAVSDQALADFCSAWLTERERLVGEAERDLAWFAQNPSVALSRATPPFVKKIGRTLPLLAALRPRPSDAPPASP